MTRAVACSPNIHPDRIACRQNSRESDCPAQDELLSFVVPKEAYAPSVYVTFTLTVDLAPWCSFLDGSKFVIWTTIVWTDIHLDEAVPIGKASITTPRPTSLNAEVSHLV